jgi:hypothetical protein
MRRIGWNDGSMREKYGERLLRPHVSPHVSPSPCFPPCFPPPCFPTDRSERRPLGPARDSRPNKLRMRYIVAISLSFLFVPPLSSGPNEGLIGDPIFGIIYDSHKVHFSLAPRAIVQRCRLNVPEGDDFRLLAYLKENNSEYMIVGNRVSQDVGGSIVVRDDQCVTSIADWLITGDPRFGPGKAFGNDRVVNVPESVVRKLVKDLLNRYSVAFGGKNHFLSALRSKGLPPSELTPLLRSELESFSRTPEHSTKSSGAERP